MKNQRIRWRWKWISGIALVVLAALAITAWFLISHAEPILRGRVISTLENRFHSKVELKSFHVWLEDGLQVSGEGLEIYGPTDPNRQKPGVQSLIGLQEFHFRTGVFSLLRTPIHVRTVKLKGLVLNIPPAGQREPMQNMSPNGKMKIYVDEFVSDGALLVINTSRPDKLPLEFDISHLKMKAIGAGHPLHFDATLVNPKPIGDITSSGWFGPWQAEQPRDTPVKGTYSFSNADLGTIKGIGGILTSTGQYDGNLGSIVVDGETETPDFRVAVSGHPVALHTEFHAIVDGTSGNTYLKPVRAKFLNSSFVADGSIEKVENADGHHIALNVVMDKARIEDLLRLGVRTDPPIMTGTVRMRTKFDLPRGDEDIAKRLGLTGNFHVVGAHFNNEKIQQKVDALSMRSQGKPKLAKDDIPDNVRSDLDGVFILKAGKLSFSKLHFEVPGTNVDLAGIYSLDGDVFDFHGKARLDAKLSQMVTGWKAVMLKPVDPFFRKRGATEIPVKITGTKSEPHFGTDFGHKKQGQEAEVMEDR